MKKFRIEVYELHSATYEVEAESLAKAVKKINDGEEELQSTQYLEDAESYGMDLESLEDEDLEELEELALSNGDFIPCIRSIEVIE
jgi:hypothetical protein